MDLLNPISPSCVRQPRRCSDLCFRALRQCRRKLKKLLLKLLLENSLDKMTTYVNLASSRSFGIPSVD